MARYRVTASSLNVREGSSITYPAIGGLKLGDEVEGLATSGDGYWIRVRKGKLEGWCSQKYLSPVLPEAPRSEFAWMAIAAAEEGTKELPGEQQNPRILEYLQSTTLPAPYRNVDETAWCSAFVNWCVERAGYEGTDSAWARSWLTWGKPVTTPRPGCVVVLARKGGGHVGFYVGRTRGGIRVLGGNQTDRVCVTTYSKGRLLGYRAPVT